MPHRHHAGELDHLAGVVEVLELETELELIRLDLLAGVAPPDARRALFDHEHVARVNFAELQTTVDERAARIARRLEEDRTKFAGLLRADLEQAVASSSHLPADTVISGRLDNLLDPSRFADPVTGAAELVADAERFHADELAASLREGVDRAVSEARAQRIPAAHLAAIPENVASRLDVAARRLAAQPHADVVAAARDAAYRATGTGLDAAGVLGRVTQAADDLSAAPLTSRYATPAAQQAHNLGHQEAAATVPATSTIYASELLDGNTCGPCSLIDGTEYGSEEEALADYPDGTYIDCEGGDRCRGTLVYVWTSEAPATVDTPGDESPPPPPPPPYQTGTTRPVPQPPGGPAPDALPSPTPDLPEPAAPEPIAPAAPTPDTIAAPLEDLADLLPETTEVGDYTDAELGAARRAIPQARAEVRAMAAQAADEARALLDGLDSLKLDQPPKRTNAVRLPSGRIEYRAEHAGEWDWFQGLSDDEQKRIRRNWTYRDAESHGSAPDEIAQRFEATFGTTSTDDAMDRWLELNRRIDANSALGRGRLINPDPYGGLDVNALVDSPYDLRVLFSNDEEAAARHLAGVQADLEDRYAERAFAEPILGPAPYEMTPEVFAAELDELDTAISNITPNEWGEYSQAEQRALDRMNELVPFGADDPANPMPADELYQVIRRLAQRAGKLAP